MKKKIILGLMSLLLLVGLGACSKEESIQEATTEVEENVSEKQTTENSLAETDLMSEESETVENIIPDSYAASIIVTINPQVKLFLDADSVIVGVEYLNEDAKEAFSDIDFSNLTVEKCMDEIIGAAIEKEFLTDGKDVSIEVAEIKEANFSGDDVCAKMEAATVEALEIREVEANVAAKVAENILSEATESGTENSETTEPETANSEITEPEITETESMTQESADTADQPEAEATDTTKPACSVCGGTGKCDECKGDGYRGSGYTVSCPRCHGSLTETCIYCDANGNSNKHEGTCDFPNCMGSHVYPCTTCGGGSIPVTCRSCNGSGKCSTCGGSGTQ